jgi:uncharacterized protein YfcZ (UPF0381/DUF406 family)
METIKWSQDRSSLKKDAHQKIQIVNSEFNSSSSNVYESSELQISETKQNHEEMSKKLHDHKKEVESKIDNIHSEIVNLRHGMNVDNLCVLVERLEVKNDELVESRLGQFGSQLHQLSVKVAAVYSTYCQPSVGGELNHVHDTKDNHARLIPTSVP